MYAPDTPVPLVGLQKRTSMLTETKQDALKRLNYITDHLAGIRKMIEPEKYYVDILLQTYAVRRAIKSGMKASRRSFAHTL
ncbi:MAG: DNA-binding transcriptional regulator, FrmR family [Chloroflexi bacterium]|jgi:DNA-binding FrmR family transcriptional regulator|nr:MAG: DNA-binding transcriptional regulator, FrmR family [Chloroflexota bacterium]